MCAACVASHAINTHNTCAPCAGQAAAELGAAGDPESIAATLAPRALRVQLHGIAGLLANGLLPGAPAGDAAQAAGGGGGGSSPRGAGAGSGGGARGARGAPPKAATLLIRYGRLRIEKPLPAWRATGGGGGEPQPAALAGGGGEGGAQPRASSGASPAATPRATADSAVGAAPLVTPQQAAAGDDVTICEEVVIPLPPALRPGGGGGGGRQRRAEEVRAGPSALRILRRTPLSLLRTYQRPQTPTGTTRPAAA